MSVSGSKHTGSLWVTWFREALTNTYMSSCRRPTARSRELEEEEAINQSSKSGSGEGIEFFGAMRGQILGRLSLHFLVQEESHPSLLVPSSNPTESLAFLP